MTAVATRKTTSPSWHPGSLQVLLANQPRTTPTPTSPLSLTARPHDWALRKTHRNTTAPTLAKA